MRRLGCSTTPYTASSRTPSASLFPPPSPSPTHQKILLTFLNYMPWNHPLLYILGASTLVPFTIRGQYSLTASTFGLLQPILQAVLKVLRETWVLGTKPKPFNLVCKPSVMWSGSSLPPHPKLFLWSLLCSSHTGLLLIPSTLHIMSCPKCYSPNICHGTLNVTSSENPSPTSPLLLFLPLVGLLHNIIQDLLKKERRWSETVCIDVYTNHTTALS